MHGRGFSLRVLSTHYLLTLNGGSSPLQVWIGNHGACHQLLEVPGAEPLLGKLHWAVSCLQ